MSTVFLPREFHQGFQYPDEKPVNDYVLNPDSDIGRHLLGRSLAIINVRDIEALQRNEFTGEGLFSKSTQATKVFESVNDRGNPCIRRNGVGGVYGEGYGLSSNPGIFSETSEFTVLFVGRNLNNSQGVAPIYQEATTGYLTGFLSTTTGVRVTVRQFQWGDTRSRDVIYPDTNTHAVGAIWRGGSDLVTYLDGELSGSDVDTGAPSTTIGGYTVSGSIFSVGPYQVGSEIEALIIIPVALSEEVVRNFTLNPYEYLEPYNPESILIPAGGGAVAQQIDLQWGVRQLINQSANLQWGVLNTVSQSSSLQWALLNTVSNNTDLRWGLLSLVNQTSDLRWDILAALGLVGQSVDLQWDMLQKAAQSTDLRWRILSLVFKDTDLRWGLINNVSQQADLRYALLANAAQTIDLQWDTLSSLASVSNSVDLRWDILAYVSQSLDAQWSTLELVSTETDLQWQIAVLVSKDADLQWALKQSAGQAVDIRWDVIATTSQSIDLRWSIISDNQFPDITGIITLKSSTAIINIGREHRSLRYSRSI